MIRPFIKKFIAVLAVSILLSVAPSFATPMQRGSDQNEQKAASPPGAEKKAEALAMEAVAIARITNDTEKMSDRLAEAMRIWIDLREPDEAARAALRVGDVYESRFEVRETFYCYGQALAVKSLSNQTSALVFYSLARAYADIYQIELAKTYYERAIGQAREAKDIRLQTKVLSGLAALHYQAKEWKEALDCIGQAQQLKRQPIDDELEAQLLLLTGQTVQEQGDTEYAREALNQALAIYKKLNHSEGQAKALYSLSALDLSLGSKKEALANAEQAVQLVGAAEKQASKDFTLLRVWTWKWRAWLAQARAQRALGERDKAAKSYFRAVGFYWPLWLYNGTSSGAVTLDEEDQAAAREYADILAEQGKVEDAYERMEEAKARTFAGLMKRRRQAGSHQADGQDETPRKLAHSIASLRTQLFSSRLSPARRTETEKEIATEELALVEARTNSEVKQHSGWLQPLALDKVQDLMNSDQACILEFFLGEQHSSVWLINADTISIATLPGRQEIEKAVESYLNNIKIRPNSLYLDRDLHTQQAMAAALFTQLLGNLAQRITPNKRLIIVPDGVLYYLPFEALIQNGRYLVEDHEISYIPSASLYGLLREAKSEAEPEDRMELLAFGDPSFDLYEARGKRAVTTDQTLAKARLRAADGFHLVALPRTRDEVEDIGKLFPQNRRQLYLGQNSTEDALKAESLRRYKRLHFATHSVVDEQHPNRSAVVLSLDADPLEDGFLEVDEISDLDLDADLVTLSACQTGRGKLFSGEGIVGLSRAFIYAGARSVAVSLWNVSDVSTGQFMKSFYQQLVKGSGNAAALREAKLQMLRGSRETRHPFYWAPFVIVGKP